MLMMLFRRFGIGGVVVGVLILGGLKFCGGGGLGLSGGGGDAAPAASSPEDEALVGLGLCAVQLGELQKAEGLLRDAEQTLRGAGGGLQLARVHAAFAEYAIAAGRTPEAARRLEEAGTIRLGIGAMTGVPWLLELWACVAVERGEFERAVRLLAASAKGRERLACPVRPSEVEFCERFVIRADEEVGSSDGDASGDRRGVLAEEGRGMPMRRALRYARGDG